jgi:RimJ/RimL family protein N-acetyltransferase
MGNETRELANGDPDLCDGVVRLRFYRARDAEAVEIAFADETIQHFLHFPPRINRRWARAYVAERIGTGERSPWPEISFVIADADTDILLGEVRIVNQTWQRSEMHYWLTPAARGRGVATKAVRLASDWALVDQHDQRVEIPVRPDNIASIRVAERAGFVFEGRREAWLTGTDFVPEAALCFVRFSQPAVSPEQR